MPESANCTSRTNSATSLMKKSTKHYKKTEQITPNYVLKLQAPTSGFLCPSNATDLVQFLEFKIRDSESDSVFFHVKRPEPPNFDQPVDLDDIRKIEYQLPQNILTLRNVGTSLVFAVGPQEIKNFRMIERHYFKDKLLRSYDFTFGFCIPNSVNTWESIYSVPTLDNKLVKNIVSNPGSTMSDSFYFADDRLIMHNKAYYTYK